MAKYKNGTYSASAQGMSKVDVNLEIKNDKIKQVKIDLPGESKEYGQKAVDQLQKQIMNSQSAEIDGVSGATLTSNAVRTATTEALEHAAGIKHKINLNLKDGTYTGQAFGHGGLMKVEVKTDNNKIKSVKVTANHESPDIVTGVLKIIPEQIVAQQTLNVDAVTGATVTSRAVINATETALGKADADIISWEKQPYKNPNAFAAHDFNTQLLVVGGGMAGLTAAAFALKNGVKDVTLIEKNSRIGGSLRYSAGGFVVTNSKVMKKYGYDDSLNRVMAYVKEENKNAKNGIDEDFVQYLLSETGKTLDQMMAMTDTTSKPSVMADPYLHVTWAENGAKTAEKLASYIQTKGGKIIVDTNLIGLVTNHEKVQAATFENKSGKFTVAADNVVIATGGTSYGHEKMMAKVTPGIAKVQIHNEANHANTGAGYDALIKVGAKPDGQDVYKNGFIMLGNVFSLALMPNLYDKAILVNAQGQRFTSEKPFDYGNTVTAMFEEGSPAYYLVFDTDLLDPKFKKLLDNKPRSFRPVMKADKLTDLAKQMNVDPATLTKTVATYNENAKQGKDEFGKEKPSDFAIFENGKTSVVPFTGKDGYYAIYVRPGAWGTMGGVKINRRMQVLTKDGKHFDNLFAAGETATGDLFAEYYMGAFSLGYYSTEGRLIGEEVAHQENN